MRADRLVDSVVGPAVLDVGCAGHVVRPDSPYWLHGKLHERFPEVVGIDINSENIDFMRQQGYGNLIVAGAEDFDLGRQFDTIVAGELIEHLASPGLFLQQCRRHLRPGGRVVLSTPYAFSLLYVLYAAKNFPKTCQNPQHTTWFCPQTIQELGSRSGFDIVRLDLIDDYELDNPRWTYRLFARAVTLAGSMFLPRRLWCNDMLVVLQSR